MDQQLSLWPEVKRQTTFEEVNQKIDGLIELVAIQRSELLAMKETIEELAAVLGEVTKRVQLFEGVAPATSRTISSAAAQSRLF